MDPDRIGMLGESLGGAISLMYAADNQEIKAVVSESSFASLQEAIDRCEFLPHLPHRICVLLAPSILSREAGCAGMDVADVVPLEWIKAMSPRPVFILHGGSDEVAGPDAGQGLYDAAGEPREFWFESDCGHGDFDECAPAEFEERLISFLDQYLLAEQLTGPPHHPRPAVAPASGIERCQCRGRANPDTLIRLCQKRDL